MENKNKLKPNRGSIVRIIISNYDTKGIKEIKVRYRKQAQLDTFILQTTLDKGNNSILISEFRVKAREKNRYSFTYDGKEKFSAPSNSVVITKIDNAAPEKFKEIRKYKITLGIDEKCKTGSMITAAIEDLLEDDIAREGIRNPRRKVSKTERKLIAESICHNYAQIAQCPVEEIDAVKIYKVKRFLSYRSNMLLFFALINDFLCKNLKNKKGEKINEIWRIENKGNNKKIDFDENYNILVAQIKEYFTKEIENYNNRIDNIIDKKELLKYFEEKEESEKNKKLEELNKLKSQKLQILSDEEIKADVIKIIKIFSDLRHSLMHYEYKYFENLFENKKNEELAELLNLNLFKNLTLLRQMKIENKTNYLEGREEFNIIGKNIKAKEVLGHYNLLAEQKNGFNNFINSFFVQDGTENLEFKKLIDKHFVNAKERLERNVKKSKKLKKELEKMEQHYQRLNCAYVWDIHSSTVYKKLYNERKNLIEKYNKQLNGLQDKNAITGINAQLLRIKKEMEEITKSNSLFRLKYKMQIAYAFLEIEFGGNIAKFKDEFDCSKMEKVQEYLKKSVKYLKYYKDREAQKNYEFPFEEIFEIKDTHNEEWLENTSENNLFKFYILTYLLLPMEFKGDFLGVVKKHYYDIKNVDFTDESEKELSQEQIDKMIGDSFFHKIRLFEKNTKRYEIIKYSILTLDEIKKYFELLELKVPYLEYKGIDEIGIFNKNIILPIFKYYQIIFRLYNDLEIHGLFNVSSDINKTLSDLKSCSGENINFQQLLYIIKKKDEMAIEEEKQKILKSLKLSNLDKNTVAPDEKEILKEINKKLKKLDGISFLRNKISHLKYEKIIEGVLKTAVSRENKKTPETNADKVFLNEKIKKIINFIKENELDKVDLGFNFINDFFMKKEQFMFGQIKQVKEANSDSSITTERKRKEDNNKRLKITYGLNYNNLSKIYEFSNTLREIVNSPLFLNDSTLLKKVDLSKVMLKEKPICSLQYENNTKLEDDIKRILLKDSSDIMGIYKAEVVKKLKEKLVLIFKYDEEKRIYVTVYDTSKAVSENISKEILVKRNNSKEEYFFEDNKKKYTTQYYTLEITKENELKVIPAKKLEGKEFKTEKKEENKLMLNNHYCFNVKIIY
ncbi:MAG: type VI-C CRISPR-associated RNA-guided ribonuclease Cas13c [Fusobacterium ulcerans]|uniref:type VI-C CRISPR-associated RNA-guided ribonuclease Cas13c n=1 Tax=Fusobacterium ulcerans TaxID=861 RepID=UPI003A89DC0C